MMMIMLVILFLLDFLGDPKKLMVVHGSFLPVVNDY